MWLPQRSRRPTPRRPTQHAGSRSIARPTSALRATRRARSPRFAATSTSGRTATTAVRPDGQVGCPEGNYLVCRDLSENDANCGACGNRCDPNPVVRNTYQGCTGGTCGWTRCINEWGNCDGDPDNGCEEHLNTNDNCNSCGNACAPGQECRYLSVGFTPPVLACTCSAGETFCPVSTLNGIPLGQCHDLSSSKIAYGACGHSCASGEVCDFGVCRLECATGTADCNGSRIDQCEVNTNADPNNCGGCGIKCDGVAGQACVGGRCVVKPCDEVDAGGGPTR